jgi:hypothetical protein
MARFEAVFACECEPSDRAQTELHARFCVGLSAAPHISQDLSSCASTAAGVERPFELG